MKQIALTIMASAFFFAADAQHDHKTHDHGQKKETKAPKKDTTPKKDTVPTKKPVPPAKDAHDHTHDAPQQQPAAATGHDHAAGGHDDHGAMSMSSAFSRNLPMNRNGSGTGWLPDESPMYGYMFHAKKWMYMLHGNVFLRYNKQDVFEQGSRGDEKFDIPNWAMLMGQRQVGEEGLFHFSVMTSLDAAIAGGSGYPLLFQTGETHKGQPLVDRQHPHDLFSELSASYAHALSPKSDVFVYLGYPGEPAIGPVAFMHRPSALNNPDATLSHHWTDATHITFGVATLGVRYGNFKLEGSSFTGREPDENRFDFDKPRFDSWSGRLSWNPTRNWALQASHGFIKEPEPIHPGEDVRRTTASASFTTKGFGSEFLNFTALWGVNKKDHHTGEHAALLEGSYTNRRLSPYFRYEWVQKSGEELQLDENHFGHDDIFPVHAFTAGLNYDLLQLGNTRVAAGTHFTFFEPDNRLNNLYGQNPIAAQIYLRIYPGMLGSRQGGIFIPQ